MKDQINRKTSVDLKSYHAFYQSTATSDTFSIDSCGIKRKYHG